MIDLVKAISAITTLATSGKIGKVETERLGKADNRWALSRMKSFPQQKIHKGCVYQFEFGKNYQPEARIFTF